VRYVIANRGRRRARHGRRTRRNVMQVMANRGRRKSRRRGTRRNPTYFALANRGRRRSRRGSRRGVRRNRFTGSRFRGFRINGRRSRRSLRRNLLATQGGRTLQIVELGPRSGRMKGRKIHVPGFDTVGYRRRFTFGGAAKRAHARKRGMSKNSRRSSMRRNPRYVFAPNRRHSRRSRHLRRNRGHRRMFRNAAVDIMQQVIIPVAGGTAGFVGARVIANAISQVSAITNILDKDKPAEMADNTKILANLLTIAATFGVGAKVEIVRKNQGAIVTGMGLALVDKLLGKIGGTAGNYLSGVGEYFEQPVAGIGEYFDQPVSGMGAYISDPTAGMGEYFEQPVAGLGAMYATAGADGLMDVAEAQAGVGAVEQAAAGMGMMYATAGFGDDATPPVVALTQVPFTSIQTPTDVASPITNTQPYTQPVQSGMVPGEATGYASGLFAGTIFEGC
jgi:hypothetical protein